MTRTEMAAALEARAALLRAEEAAEEAAAAQEELENNAYRNAAEAVFEGQIWPRDVVHPVVITQWPIMVWPYHYYSVDDVIYMATAKGICVSLETQTEAGEPMLLQAEEEEEEV